MGLREWANNHPRAAAIIVSVCVVACLVLLGIEIRGDRRPPIGVLPDHYFTIDDGKTFFTANGANIPPFEYQGHEAVRAYMFEADGKRFIGYLMRYTPDARRAEVAKTITPQQEVEGKEVKKPGDVKWIPTSDPVAARIVRRVAAPGESSTVPMPVEP